MFSLKKKFSLNRLIFSFLILLLLPRLLPAQTVVEGLVAVINIKSREPIREVLFFSDLERYRLFFESPGEKTQSRGKPSKHEKVWERLQNVIDHRLLQQEAFRFILDPPTEKEVLLHLKNLPLRFKNKDAFKRALKQTALKRSELKKEILNFLWVEKLIQERILEFIFISPREIERYYLDHLNDFLGKPLSESEKAVEQILTREKKNTKRKAYLERLKEKTTIEILLKKNSFIFSMNK